MDDVKDSTTELLDVAKDLIDRRRLDLEGALAMLNALPRDIDGATRSSVEQALQTVAAADQDSRYEAVARFALARVVVLLETHRSESGGANRRRSPSDVSGVA